MDVLALISHNPLDQASSTPLYLQLKRRIMQLILTRTIAEGERLPTEQELCDAFGLSRATVRRCFKDLVDSGYVLRRRGLGSVVARPPIGKLDNLYLEISTSSYIERSGAKASSRFLGLRKIQASEALAQTLRVDVGSELWEVNRLRLADGTPVIHERAYVPCELCPELSEDMLESRSLYQCIAEQSGAFEARTEERLEPVALDKREATLLGCPEGSPGLRNVIRSLDIQGRPIEASVGLIPPGRFHLEITYDVDAITVRKMV